MALAQGLIDNSSLRLLDLTNNQIGSKGTMLICEALKGNKHILSLLLNGNKIGTEGAYAISDLLLDAKSNLLELHIGWNLICNTGLNSLFTALAMTNQKLKFLDISYNFIDISVMHSLRLMIERNSTLKYFSINDLHRFNPRAVESLISSFQVNTALRMVDVQLTTLDFYEQLTNEVNAIRDERIEFRRDAKLLVRPKALREAAEDMPDRALLISRSAERLGKRKEDDLLEPVSINMVTPDFAQAPQHSRKTSKPKHQSQ